MQQIAPIENDQRNDRSQLDDDEEREHCVIRRDFEQLLGNEQMSGGGDRNEFRESLNDAEKEGLKDVQCISPIGSNH